MLAAVCEEGTHALRDESCHHRGTTAFTNAQQWTSGSMTNMRTTTRKCHPLGRATTNVGEAKWKRQLLARQIIEAVQEDWVDFGAFCVLQSINGLADWYDKSRASNAK